MTVDLTRRSILAGAAGIALGGALTRPAAAADKILLRLSSPASPTDQRAVGLMEKFGPAIKDFATFEPHWNAELFKQGTENEAIARGNLEMAISSAQELATIIPAWSVFTAGYLLRDAEHQKRVFNSDIMDDVKKKTLDKLGIKLLSVMYLGRRQLNLRGDKQIKTPADLEGVKLRMPSGEAWLFLGRALGANPVPMAFTEVYTALQTGAIDGQDNPLPSDKDSKFYEVTNQIVLTSHLVDWNFLSIGNKVWEKFTPEQQKIVQKAADDACEHARQAQLKLETELEGFFKEKGLKVYTPDVDAFRKHVQAEYLKSKFSKDWQPGIVDKINAIK
jgi:TRAP-type C4-dicarboxylate transport system substrate-binding protein